MSGIVKTMHEPFSGAYYLSRTDKALDSSDAIFNDVTHEKRFDDVINKILETERIYGTVFIKELAYCVIRQSDFQKYRNFWEKCRHVYLVRHPISTIPSLAHQMQRVYGDNVDMDRIEKAIGIADLLKLIIQLKNWDLEMYRVQSEAIVDDPEKTLSELCGHLDLPWDNSKLHWSKGSLPDWKIWEDAGWHDRAKETTGFQKADNAYDVSPYEHMVQKYLPDYFYLLELC